MYSVCDCFPSQVMSSLLSSATWDHPRCLDIMFVTSRRREGELRQAGSLLLITEGKCLCLACVLADNELLNGISLDWYK